jgi:hypothetical protein
MSTGFTVDPDVGRLSLANILKDKETGCLVQKVLCLARRTLTAGPKKGRTQFQ